MNDSIFCQIRIKGHLSSQCRDWLGGLAVENQPGGETMLSGVLADQAALFGVLGRVRDLGVALVSLHCSATEPCKPLGAGSDQGD